MPADVTLRAGTVPLARRFPTFGLSWRILGLVIAAVMTAELLLFLPSIGRFRLVYLEQLIESGTLAALAPEGAALLQRHKGLAAWWAELSARPSFAATDPGLPPPA